MSGPPHTLFRPGQSGNPKGKPKGTKNRKTILLQALEMDESALATAIKRGALEDRDPTCISLWTNRIEPALRSASRRVNISLDLNATPGEQSKTIIRAVTRGELDLESAEKLFNMLAAAQGFENMDAFLEELRRTQNRKDNHVPGGVVHEAPSTDHTDSSEA